MDKAEYASLAFDAGFDAGRRAGFFLADKDEPSEVKIKRFAQLERETNNGEISLDEALARISN